MMTTPQVDEADRAERLPRHVDHQLGAGLIALGAGLAVNSLHGPFVFGIVDYPLSETLRNQTIGLDAVSCSSSLRSVSSRDCRRDVGIVPRPMLALRLVRTPRTCWCSTSSVRHTSTIRGCSHSSWACSFWVG